MAKLRKQRRRKVYRHNVNRKRLRNKITNVGTIGCEQIKKAWEDNKSLKKNLLEMGLSYDPNETIPLKPRRRNNKLDTNDAMEESTTEFEEKTAFTQNDDSIPTSKSQVVDLLEQEAKAPRQRLFRLPKGQVEWITYLMDKHGSDFKAMVRDKKNYKQETWKQLRAKIKTFQGIPEQYNSYLAERNITTEIIPV